MQIGELQMSALSRSVRMRATAAQVSDLRARFPAATRVAGQAALMDAVMASGAAAQKYGLDFDAAQRLFLHWSVLLGTRFDEDPQFEWLAELLARDLALPPMLRLRVVEWNVWAYLDRSCGVHGEFSRAAWARVSTLDARQWQAIVGDIDQGGARWMDWLHPQQASFVEPAARTSVVDAARCESTHWGLEGPQPGAVIAVVMFMMGRHVLESPLHPWIRGAIAAPDPVDTRYRRLLAQLREHAQAMASHVQATPVAHSAVEDRHGQTRR